MFWAGAGVFSIDLDIVNVEYFQENMKSSSYRDRVVSVASAHPFDFQALKKKQKNSLGMAVLNQRCPCIGPRATEFCLWLMACGKAAV